MKFHMHFRSAPSSMTLEFDNFFLTISQIWQATTTARMKDPYCLRQNCWPLIVYKSVIVITVFLPDCLSRIFRLSVRPSHGWISQKRSKLGLWNFQLTVASSLYFLWRKFHLEILTGPHRAGASNRGGWENKPFSSLVNISKTVADTSKVTIND